MTHARFERVAVNYALDAAPRLFIDRGEIIGLVGENGSGKSTLGRGIAGLQPLSGVHLFDGHGGATSLDSVPSWKRSTLGILYVPSEDVFADLTVAENLRLARVPTRATRRRYEAIQQRVHDIFDGLLPPLDRQGQSLSGGERRFVALTRALLAFALTDEETTSFPLLIIDEPTAGVYIAAIDTIGRALRALAQRGVAILVIEQTGTPLHDLFHRSYTMAAGQITSAAAVGVAQ